MPRQEKLELLKEMIESRKLKNFRDIFHFVTRTEISATMGINYTRLRGLIQNPKKLRYEEAYLLAKILDVQARDISELIHNQLDTKKGDRPKAK